MSWSGSASFSGVDPDSIQSATTVTYSGQAQSSLSGGLKASSTITSDRLFWNNAENASFVNDDYSVNPLGLPDHFSSSSSARITDSFTLLGGDDLASVKFIFALDGSLISTPGTGASAHVSLSSYDAVTNATALNFYYTTYSNYGPTSVWLDQQVTSDFFSVVDGKVAFDISLNTSASMRADVLNYASGSYPGGTATSNFFSTVKIAQVLGFNSRGEQVELFSVTGGDGTLLPVGAISAVPEPATWAMMIVGFGAVGSMVRTTRRRNAALAA